MTERLETGWLLGATAEGIAAVGPERSVSVRLDGELRDRHRLVAALAAGEPLDGEAAALRRSLVDAGALVRAPAQSGALLAGARPLAEALRATDLTGAWFTAEELLVVPAGVDPRLARRALHAFVGGLVPKARAEVYAEAAASGAPPSGERPLRDLDPADLAPGRFHVARAGGGTASLTPAELDGLDATLPHRLGVVQEASTPSAVRLAGRGRWIAQARYANPNIRLPARGLAHGIDGDPEHAALIARAEAAERHAIGRTSGVELRRAAEGELDAPAIGFERFWAPNARQARALGPLPDSPPLWAAARTAGGTRHWVPAAQVLLPFADPEHPDPRPGGTSSGAAAFTDPAGAAERALLELVERDALMWHWIQRATPRRLAEGPLPDPVRESLAAVRAAGWSPALLDLTLDTVPVILALLRDGSRLALGLSAGRTAQAAAGRALEEAMMIGRLDGDGALAPLADPAAVRTPEDHLALHHHADHAEAHRFLLDGEAVDPREVPAPDGGLRELVAEIAEPLFVRHDVPAVRPFVVVRALVPGLVPICFGWDREPLGLPRLARPIRTRDGRELGRSLDLAERGPILPHPFP